MTGQPPATRQTSATTGQTPATGHTPATGIRPPRPRLACAALTVAAIAAFGPYTPLAGIRAEQVVVYGLCAVALASLRWCQFRFTRAAALVFGLLTAETLVAVFGALVPVPELTGFGRASTLAGLDNLALPLAVLITLWTLLDMGADRKRLLAIVCRVVIWAMCLNAVLAYVSQAHDLTPMLSRFWDNTVVENTVTDTVAGRASQLGRYTGIFNQPAEAGEMYSIALLAAIYRYRSNLLRFAGASLLITVGGLLTVSKVFLLVGLPIAVWQVLRQSHGRGRRVVLLAAAVIAVAGLAQSGVGPQWIGGDFLAQLLRPGTNGDMLHLYTGGRLGDSSSLQTIVAAVLHDSPWFGFGAGGLAVPYDDAWVEALCVAGLCGAILYTMLLAVLALSWYRRRLPPDPGQSRLAQSQLTQSRVAQPQLAQSRLAQSRLGGGIVLLVIGASVGLPALTANRAATIAWLMIGLVLLAPPGDTDANTGTAPAGVGTMPRARRGTAATTGGPKADSAEAR
ncbi:hypothetical protein [Rugosimonospora africana]|uniref:Uncharacterized protein n=1 Tax=Rugosimonospora africana TaxID=556532 RepID=A0A8J3VQ63_9ACTN|nr:hypothetical protein [Rugosimonospora africana]GIH14814.1 hypothetical protein Raf01_29860 [Rugosimonospora africana]